MMPPDGELVARVLATDDRHAFAELVRRHQSLVRALLRRLCCGDRALADDLAQETFLRAYRGLPRYRGSAKLSSWLYRIAYNVFLDHRSRAGVRGAVAEAETDAEGVTPRGGDENTLLQHDLARAMAMLSPAERATVTLAYARDLSHSEIAEVLDCPIGTVKTHLARAKEKLETRLRSWSA